MHFIYCHHSRNEQTIIIKFTKIFPSVITLYRLFYPGQGNLSRDRNSPYNFYFLEHHGDTATLYLSVTIEQHWIILGDICSRKSTRRMVHRRLWISLYSRRSRWNGRYKYREVGGVYTHCVTVFLTLRRLDEGSVALTKI